VSACIAALGGAGNIVRVEACGETRLRVVVRDDGQVSEPALRAEGVAVVKLDGRIFHLLTGRDADQCAAEMRGQLTDYASGGATAA
jgi:PTS system glucose-specific IIC component